RHVYLLGSGRRTKRLMPVFGSKYLTQPASCKGGGLWQSVCRKTNIKPGRQGHMKRYFIVAAVALIAGTVPGWTQGSRPAPIPCTPAMGLNYICNLGRPEDFVWIPNTKYIII